MQKFLTSMNSEVVHIQPHCSSYVKKERKKVYFILILSLSLSPSPLRSLHSLSHFSLPPFPSTPLTFYISRLNKFFFSFLVNSSLLSVIEIWSAFGLDLGGVWVGLWSGNWVVFGSAFRWRLGCIWVVEQNWGVLTVGLGLPPWVRSPWVCRHGFGFCS